MKPNPEQINRLGFETWASNVIVNWLENMAGEEITARHLDHPDWSMVITREGNKATATVRAYVEGRGWFTHERVLDLTHKDWLYPTRR